MSAEVESALAKMVNFESWRNTIKETRELLEEHVREKKSHKAFFKENLIIWTNQVWRQDYAFHQSWFIPRKSGKISLSFSLKTN